MQPKKNPKVSLENKKLERKSSPTSVEEIFDESKEFMGGRKRKTKSRKKRGGFMPWMGLTKDFIKNNFDRLVERGTKIKIKVGGEEERDIILHKDEEEDGNIIHYKDTDGHYFVYRDPDAPPPPDYVHNKDLLRAEAVLYGGRWLGLDNEEEAAIKRMAMAHHHHHRQVQSVYWLRACSHTG